MGHNSFTSALSSVKDNALDFGSNVVSGVEQGLGSKAGEEAFDVLKTAAKAKFGKLAIK